MIPTSRMIEFRGRQQQEVVHGTRFPFWRSYLLVSLPWSPDSAAVTKFVS